MSLGHDECGGLFGLEVFFLGEGKTKYDDDVVARTERHQSSQP